MKFEMTKYLDNIIDALLEVHIFEMAVQRKEIVKRMDDLSFKIAEHISLIICYPNESASTHWVIELESWLDSIGDMRFDRTKTLKEFDYFKSLWARLFEHTNYISTIFVNKITKKGLPKFDLSKSKMYEERIEKFFSIVSKLLSVGKPVIVKDILKEL